MVYNGILMETIGISVMVLFIVYKVLIKDGLLQRAFD